jgi:hypothetical protein
VPSNKIKVLEKHIIKGDKAMSDKTFSQVPEKPDHPLPDSPPGMRRVTEVELVWPGKYNDDGIRKEVPRVSLPFQVIETINGSRTSRKAEE